MWWIEIVSSKLNAFWFLRQVSKIKLRVCNKFLSLSTQRNRKDFQLKFSFRNLVTIDLLLAHFISNILSLLLNLEPELQRQEEKFVFWGLFLHLFDDHHHLGCVIINSITSVSDDLRSNRIESLSKISSNKFSSD